MAESGDTSSVANAMERLTEALLLQAQKHAEATVPPSLPAWAVNTLVGLVVALIMAIGTSLVQYGVLQNRVSNLESVHPETIAALAAEFHTFTATFSQRFVEMERRLNDLADRDKGK